MVAIEATIVSTAMPQIVGQLGGLPLYSWVFAAFLLTQTATTVVFGKLADLAGRKLVMLVGIAAFLFGSILCGFAWSMPSLIVFRLVQGIGAGAVQPTAMTIVGDLYSAHERGKIQGWLASVWAVSAILGPLAGGLIIQYFSWAWIFWMNLPIGVLASAGFWAFLHEKSVRGRGKIDHLSAGIFTVAIAAIMADLTAAFDLGPARNRAHHSRRIGCGRAVRPAGAPLSGADDFARALGSPADRRRQCGFAPGRHGDDRPHHVSAGVRAGRDADSRRSLAVSRSPQWCSDGQSGRRSAYASASGASACAPCCGSAACSFRWVRSFFSSSTGRVRQSWLALARSSSASAWASPAAPRSS